MSGTHRVEVFEGENGRWFWRERSANGQITSTSSARGKGYRRKWSARRAARKARPGLPVWVIYAP